jgi:hypothetical protein
MVRVATIACIKGCVPGVGLSRALGLSCLRRSWSTWQRWPNNEPCSPRCGTGLPWCCWCSNRPWYPTSKPQHRCSCLPGRCNDGAAGGPPALLPWTTSRDGAARPLCPPLDHALVKAVACALLAETHQPLRRPSLAEVTVRVRTVLGEPLRRSTGWRIVATDASKPWRYTDWSFPRDPDCAEQAGPIRDLDAGTWPVKCLGPKDHVLSADAKTRSQARIRGHGALSPAPGRPA